MTLQSIPFEVRLSVPFLLYQFGRLALGGQETVPGYSEIDLIVPTSDTAYEVGADHRFPIVWAILNPSIWKNTTVITWSLDNNTQPAYPGDTKRNIQGDATFLSNETADGVGVRFASADTLLIPAGTYHLTWRVNRDNFGCDKAPPDTKKVNFSTKPGGEKGDLRSAAHAHCANRTGLAYNIVNITDSCHMFDEDDPFPTAAPCELQVDLAAIANITKSLDAQYNTSCSDRYYSPLCSQPTEKKSMATQLSTGVLVLGLPLMALFL